MTIGQKVLDICTVVTDVDGLDIDDIYMREVFGTKFGKVTDGRYKNPILRIGYIYSRDVPLEHVETNTGRDIPLERLETEINKSEYPSDIYNSKYITEVGNGREKVLFEFGGLEKPKLLLHICCAPDLTYPLYWLKRYFKIYLFWYNPNIHPRREHDLRYEQYLKLFELETGDYEIVEDWYDPKEFFASFGKYRKLIKD